MRSLDIFIFDEMIEQYNRFNPAPDMDNTNPSIKEQMESEMLVSLLTELKALRPRVLLYEARIVHLNRDLKNLMIENAELKRTLQEK
jgi:hypothetical protein